MTTGGEVSIKRGVSLKLGLAFTDEFGDPIDLSAATITAQARDKGTLVADLPITAGANPGARQIIVADTASWPERVLFIDLCVQLGGMTDLTDTFQIRVERPVTQ